MEPDHRWYVLVEANSDSMEPQWELRETHHVEGDRVAALARAAEIYRTWCPETYSKPEEYGRRVFQTSETSWLVEVTRQRWFEGSSGPYTRGWHIRVTAAELVHVDETPPAHPPEKKPSAFRRAFGR